MCFLKLRILESSLFETGNWKLEIRNSRTSRQPVPISEVGLLFLLSAFCFLLSAFCLLPSAFCLLLSAFCFLPSAFCLPPSAF